MWNGVVTSVGGKMAEMEKLVVDIQELLRLQYEGQAVLDMFGKAKVNVNLLLHFLNAKFYGK